MTQIWPKSISELLLKLSVKRSHLSVGYYESGMKPGTDGSF